MLRTVTTTLGSALILAASIAAGHADGVTSAPRTLADDAPNMAVVQPVADPCAPRWQCSPYGCGWRQVCAVPAPAYVPAYYYARPRAYSYDTNWVPRWRYSYGYAPRHSWHGHHHGYRHYHYRGPQRHTGHHRDWR